MLTGEPTPAHDAGETILAAGVCAGFPHGGTAHQLVNRSRLEATCLEAGASVDYPRDDFVAVRRGAAWAFEHQDGMPY